MEGLLESGGTEGGRGRKGSLDINGDMLKRERERERETDQ